MNWRRYITYPLICWRNGSNELRYLKQLYDSQYWNEVQIASSQLTKIRILVDMAYKYVPYYRELFQTINFNPGRIKNIDDFKNIPLLSKKTVQEQYERLFSEFANKNDLIYDKTGGSTGIPTRFAYTNDRLDMRLAAAHRHDEWAGYNIGEKLAILWGSRRDFLNSKTLKSQIWDFLTSRVIVFDTSSITDEKCEKFTDALQKFKPKCILAYAQSLEYFAKYIKNSGKTVFTPKAIITSAELLTLERRRFIQQIFQAPIFDRYGSRETSVIASECEYHTMHIHNEGMYVEFLRADGTPCTDGEEGEIVITDLLNTAFPLIRYRIGDMGVPIKNECPCGRALSTMKIISGRTSDFVITPQGRKVSGAAITAYVCAGIEGLNQVQIYQETTKEIFVKMIKNKKYTDQTINNFVEKARSFLDGIEVIVEIVDTIPVSESGKHQFCVNKLIN